MGPDFPAAALLAGAGDRAQVDRNLLDQLQGQRQLFDGSPDGIVLCDGNGVILLVNRRLEELLGYAHGALTGQAIEVLVPEERRSSHTAHRSSFTHSPKVRPMAPTLELFARHADGSEIPVEIALAPLHYEGRPVIMATVRDSRERLHHLRLLREAEQRLLLADERERIARDLHDIVIQRLFATGLSIQSAAMRVAEPLRPRLDQAVDAIDEAIHDIRSSIFRLSHAGPARDSIRAGLLDLAAEAERLLGFLPRVHLDGAVDSLLDDELGAEVLGVIRELVSNAVRHARCSELLIAVAVDDEWVRCSVTDNGEGPGDLDAPRAGRGLRNLDERARRNGGRFALEARAGGGSVATWSARLR
jgi:PAS domain S-box-containing protein